MTNVIDFPLSDLMIDCEKAESDINHAIELCYSGGELDLDKTSSLLYAVSDVIRVGMGEEQAVELLREMISFIEHMSADK